MGAKIQSQSRFMRAITMPFRALGKARDLYVKSVTRCVTGGIGYNAAGGYHEPLPRSFSVGSSSYDGSDDFKELMRAASIRSLEESIRMDLMKQRSLSLGSSNGNSRIGKVLPKSCSVGMGRIDEDMAYDDDGFGGGGGGDEKMKGERNGLKNDHQFYGRSKSYAVPTMNDVVF